ncbi:MAG TPA: NAD(P)H-hydrate epimerase, partial [Bacteroidetes bacterium]|nr:NAD(P)H-hydrate epimerase [Bacteroidota bacterium]
MRKVVTASQMGQMDRETIERVGIPGVVLMENAGLGVVSVAEQLLGGSAARKHVVVVAGKGNNGGDGFVVARHLHNRGADAEVYLLADPDAVKGDARTNLNILQNMGLPIRPVEKRSDFGPRQPLALIVDAIFGTGISGAVRGLPAEIIDAINSSPAPVLSVDLPSGLNADTGAVEGPCVKATATATMAEVKRGLLLPPGRDFAGRVHVVDISMP